ncbi:MAG: hypothetical protein GF329_10655, partial [Candidatus Lokiarchaeota archaeon]|nr:hypothetical protein [Candidatus Lokiarchaeota archaeon]
MTYNFSDGDPIFNANLTYFESTVGSGNLNELGGGLYYFTVNSSIPIGTYSILVSCDDYGYSSAQIILEVNSIATEVNYTSAISVETLDTFNVRIFVNDTDHNLPISGVNVTYTLLSLNGNLSDESIIGNPGYYNKTINVTLSPRDVPYYLVLTLDKENYSFSQIYISITVRPITTNIFPLESIYEIFYNGLINLTVTYNFSDGDPILGANLSYFETTLGLGNLNELGGGLYYFTVNSSIPIGTYSILISCDDYGYTSAQIILEVMPIATEVNYTSAISVETLDTFDMRIFVNDTDHNLPITGINISYTLETLNGNLMDENTIGNPGYYNTTINATLTPRDVPYYLVINLEKENYTFNQVIISISVRPIETTILPTEPSFQIYYNALINITVSYNFSNGDPILGSNLSYLEPTIGTSDLLELGGGIYYFTVNSSHLGIGTHSFEISCDDYGFTSSQAILIVRPIQTEIIYNSSISVKTLDSFYLRIYLNDTDHKYPISGARINYSLSTIMGNLTDESINGNFGYYNATISATLQPRDASYNLILTIEKENYSFSNIVIPVVVKPIETYIYSLEPFFEVSFKDLVNISVSYNFTNGDPITDANLSYYEVSIGLSELKELGNGLYYLTINSSLLSIGTYYIIVSCDDFGFTSIQTVLKINPIQVNASRPSSLVDYSGVTSIIEIWLRDEVYNDPITGANVSFFFQGVQGYLTEDTENEGRYFGSIDIEVPASEDPYLIVIQIQKENYSTETFTIPLNVVIPPSAPTPWYIQWGWLLGIAAALGAVVAGYKIRGKWRSRNWEQKINRLYAIHSKDGVAIYERSLTKKKMDSQLASAALMGITGMVKELTSSERKLKTIDHMDKKVIFEYGNRIIGAILADGDLPIIRKKLQEFITNFEARYQAQLMAWNGDIAIFKNIDKLTNSIFPFATIVKHREPVPEKEVPLIINQELLAVLNSVNDGLKESDLIAAYNDLKVDQVTLDLAFLIDNGFIDNKNDLNLTEKGIKAIYHTKKKIESEEENIIIPTGPKKDEINSSKGEKLEEDKPRIPR